MEAKRQFDQAKQDECMPPATDGQKACRFSQPDSEQQHEQNKEVQKLRAAVRTLERELTQKDMAMSLVEMERSAMATSMEAVTTKLEASILALQAANLKTGKELSKVPTCSLPCNPALVFRCQPELLLRHVRVHIQCT